MESRILIAIDWADRKHDVCLLDTKTGQKERSIILQKPEAIESWVLSLKKRFKGEQLSVILEQSKGGLIYALMKYDFLVLYPVNPATLARYREAFAPSGAKDDPTDAEFMLEILLKHRDRVNPWKPDTAETRTLQLLVEGRRKLVNDRKRLGNRLTSLLKSYYPQVLELFPKMGRAVLCEFVLRYPTLEVAQKTPDQELMSFFRSHRSANKTLLQKRLDFIKNSIALTNDSAIIASSVIMAKAICEQILCFLKACEEFDEKIAALFSTHSDAAIFSSLPATGPNLAPRLLAALGTDRTRFSSPEEIQCFAGIAPVVERSGKHEWIRWRYGCNKFLRQSFHEWAGLTVKHSLWARAFYAMQRKKGKSHSVVVRALAYKWIRIIFRLWKDKILYNEATYLESLQRSGSPIFKFMAENSI